MTDDIRASNYNLRSKRVGTTMSVTPAPPSASGFILASELLRRHQCEAGGGGDSEAVKDGETPTREELVSDLPSERHDEGSGASASLSQPTADQLSDQRDYGSSGSSQGRQPASPHRTVVDEGAQYDQPEVLRLRVRVIRNIYDYVPVNLLI